MQFVSFRIRFPKNHDVAAKWNIALGFDGNKILHGFVCFEHFEDDRFKRKNKSELKADAIPTIIELAEPIPTLASATSRSDTVAENSIEPEFFDEMDGINGCAKQISDCLSNEVIVTIATVPAVRPVPTTRSQCQECKKRGYLISKQQDEIRELRMKLKKANAKIYYLDSTKRKLETAFSEMKQEKLINEELSKSLEV